MNSICPSWAFGPETSTGGRNRKMNSRAALDLCMQCDDGMIPSPAQLESFCKGRCSKVEHFLPDGENGVGVFVIHSPSSRLRTAVLDLLMFHSYRIKPEDREAGKVILKDRVHSAGLALFNEMLTNKVLKRWVILQSELNREFEFDYCGGMVYLTPVIEEVTLS